MKTTTVSRFDRALDEYLDANPDLFGGIQDGIREVVYGTFRPRIQLDVDECADRYRRMPAHNGIPGDWSTESQQVGQGAMKAVTEPGVHTITGCVCTQVLKTALLENTILHSIVVDPSPMIVVEPTKGMAEDLVANKLRPMLELVKHGVKKRIRKSLMGRITFDGGFLKIANARSAVNIAMNAVRIVMSDEIDKNMFDKAHGDPVANAERRNSTFGSRKKNIRVCSPSTERGAIWQSWLSSDQRRPYVRCPHCQHEHIMRWRTWMPWRINEKGVVEPNEPYDFNDVRPGQDFSIRPKLDQDGQHEHDEFGAAQYAYHCPNPSCAKPWSEFDRLIALRRIVWRQTRPFTCCGRVQHPEIERRWVHEDGKGNVLTDDEVRNTRYVIGYAVCSDPDCHGKDGLPRRKVPRGHAGFWANRFYDMIDGSATNIMKLFHGREGGYKSFVNSDMAEVFNQSSGLKMSVTGLAARETVYDAAMPRRAAIITAGIDTQIDRLALAIWAHGRDGEMWLLHYEELQGDTTQPYVWDRLETMLVEGAFRDAKGVPHRVMLSCLDIAGAKQSSQMAIAFTKRRRLGQRVLPIVGKQEGGNNEQAPIWPLLGAKLGKARYEIGTHTAKDLIEHMMAQREPGPNYMHFPSGKVPEGFYDMLLSEERKTRENSSRMWWDKRYEGIRNEALDCTVYAIAARVAMETIKPVGGAATTVREWADKMNVPDDVQQNEYPTMKGATPVPAAPVAQQGISVLTSPTRSGPKRAPKPFMAKGRGPGR